MRLSEDRIQDIAKKIADDLIDRNAVDPKAGRRNLATLVAQVMINDLSLEDKIDEETRARLARQKNLPPPGTGQYEAMFLKVKEQIAREKGWPM